ncbi:hypothetical protein PHAVU_002G196000 [Phaseolus vulgaris]|uniref:Uncharacterized protein n=1 Tax=Phaseolus vulgaris TaxID=3885 RepID=V7CNX6_PHAVU|nr:hypothetical protein PHAVU_002G196000g [Phaseolus vulgaris]XP_007158957.1 hypothetical protein PHAVU_002G195900g [Phaseolus vulgaris]ESW30950.1 hypothetical protein PHAVU_002G196000g [Phaseolus vulgaris]ESW30951.1 hypothetical protein PHAVU_002G195900g [Phaseolus vulgaris]
MPSRTREEVDKTSIRESSTQVHKLPRVDGHLALPTMAPKMLSTTLVGESRISELPSSTLVVGSIKNLSLLSCFPNIHSPINNMGIRK